MIIELILISFLISVSFMFLGCYCLKLALSSYRGRPRGRNRQNNNDEVTTCSICLAQVNFQTETNCGHLFCANCIIQYWRTSAQNSHERCLKCPLCRQTVNCLLPSFSGDEYRSDDYEQVMDQINEFNRRYCNDPTSLFRNLMDLPVIIKHLFSETFIQNTLTFLQKIKVFIIAFIDVLYLVSPIDILPEAVFGIAGYIDDLVIVVSSLLYLSTFYRNILSQRQQNNRQRY